jgi:Domain of unknown function (DUF4194)
MLKQWLEQQLETKAILVDEFTELLIRLLDYGVICRDESQVEQKLYDRFLQCEELIDEYLSILAIRLDHNRRFHVIRIFPPGAEVPGLPDEEQEAFNGGMRARLSQMEVALVLVLRIEYAKQLREGRIDENGCVLVSLEGLTIAFNNLLKRSLPENITERRALFRRLRQLRLVNYQQEDDLDNPEGWLRIRPSITSFVTDEARDALVDQQELDAYDLAQSNDSDDELEKSSLFVEKEQSKH